MSDIKLGSNDYLAIAKALDKNNNNKVDNAEANFTQRANMMIGNANSINGVREVAESLERGDIVLTGLDAESSDKIATYFSDRANNQGVHPTKWKNDGWISKADLEMSDRTRKLIDINGDNRISSREFSDALRTGKISLSNNSVSTNPSSTDPFGGTKPNTGTTSNDPFGGKPANNTKPSTSNDPFSGKPTTAPVNNNNSTNPFNNSKPTNNNTSSNPFGGNTTNSTQNTSNSASNPFGSKPANNNQNTSNTTSSNPFGSQPINNNTKPSNSSDPFSKH